MSQLYEDGEEKNRSVDELWVKEWVCEDLCNPERGGNGRCRLYLSVILDSQNDRMIYITKSLAIRQGLGVVCLARRFEKDATWRLRGREKKWKSRVIAGNWIGWGRGEELYRRRGEQWTKLSLGRIRSRANSGGAMTTKVPRQGQEQGMHKGVHRAAEPRGMTEEWKQKGYTWSKELLVMPPILCWPTNQFNVTEWNLYCYILYYPRR